MKIFNVITSYLSISILLILLCLLPNKSMAQVPSHEVRVVNCIMLWNAMDYLDVPLYLDENTNSQRTYSWYATKTSFGVTAKASDEPVCRIECIYENGRLSKFKLREYYYYFQWDNDYITRITRYNSDGQVAGIDFGLKSVIKNLKPERLIRTYDLRSFVYHGGWWPDERMCFFENTTYYPNAKSANGKYYYISYIDSGDDLHIEKISFSVNIKGLLSQKSFYSEQTLDRFTYEHDGYFYSEKAKRQSLHKNRLYIEELDVIF